MKRTDKCLTDGEVWCYIDNDFTFWEREEVEDHIRCCRECQVYLELLEKRTRSLSRDIPDWDQFNQEELWKKEQRKKSFSHMVKKGLKVALLTGYFLLLVHLISSAVK